MRFTIKGLWSLLNGQTSKRPKPGLNIHTAITEAGGQQACNNLPRSVGTTPRLLVGNGLGLFVVLP